MLFLKTAVRVLIGVIVLAIGVFGRWDQTTRKAATEAALADLEVAVASGIPVLSPDEVTTAYDGQPVFVQGELEPGRVRDPLTGLEMAVDWLKRTVELEQWKEESDCSRSTIGSTRSCRYSYHRVWSAKLIDSDSFSSPLFGENEHENPKAKPLEEPTFFDRELALGAWSVDTAHLSGGFTDRGEVTAETMASADLGEDWRADGVYAYSRSDPTVRLRYSYLAAPKGLVSLIAIPRERVLTLNEALAPLPLLVVGDVDAKDIVEAAGGQVREPQPHWLFYSFFGFMMLIRPVARRFSALNDFTFAPFGRRLAITAGLAAFLTLAVGVAFPG